ncbi:MAG: methyl-accepting chemotaxis protein [Pseudodesulfovibrio sp.]
MQFKSVNTVITVLVAVVISLTMVSGVLWIIRDTKQVVFHEEKVAMNNVAEQIMAGLDQYVSQTKSTVRVMAAMPSVVAALEGGDAAAAGEFFKKLIASSDGYWAAFAFDREGKIVAGFNAKGDDMAGADRSGRQYVKEVLQGRAKTFLSKDVLKAKSGDGDLLIFAASNAVLDASGRLIGGVGLFPKWEAFTGKFVDPFRVAEHGYPFMLDQQGRLIGHAVDKSLILKDISKEAFVRAALAQKRGMYEYVWTGRNKIMAFDTEPETGWVVAVSAYEDDLVAAAVQQRNVLTVGGVVAALLLIAIVVLMVRKVILAPVKGILDYASGVASGDLNTALEGSYHFEFKVLSSQIEIMVGELKTKLGFSEGVLNGLTFPCIVLGPDHRLTWINQEICDLLDKKKEPKAFIGQLSGNFFYGDDKRKTLSDKALAEQEPKKSEVEIALPTGRSINVQVASTPFYDMDGKLLGSLTILADVTEIREQQKQIEVQNARISKAAHEAEEISQYLSSAAEQLAAQIEEASRGSEQQKQRAGETAVAMEEMNSTVLEVARNAGLAAEDADTARSNAQKGEGIVGQVIVAVGDVESQAASLKKSMEELGNQAADIGKVLEVITDIADQTNLLALNAAIEAARAGEAGRGFAVVADEVRKLAEKTMAATSEVGQAIGKIQTMTKENVAATEAAAASVGRSTELANESGRSLKEIVSFVDNAADQVRAIATAAEQQSATSEEINRATEEINRISVETSQVMNEAAQAIQEVSSMASRLNTVIEDMTR